MMTCLVCPGHVDDFISFGRMPIANGFLRAEDFDKEFRFELRAGFCERCGMVQLSERVDKERLFHSAYPFFSSTSLRMADHFRAFAEWVSQDHLPGSGGFVVEIGSNDGIMLQHFARNGIRHLGIEPSQNVAEVARQRGIETIVRFFDGDLAREIVDERGQADIVLGANVMCHIPQLHALAAGVKRLLKPTGALIFEDPYLGNILDKTAYDQIYDEHVFYFCLASLDRVFEQHDLEIVDAQPQPVHGGSMRYVVTHAGRRPPSSRLTAQRAVEKALGLEGREAYDSFRARVECSRDALRDLLEKLQRENQRVIGYGATSKSTTVLNYCGITEDLVPFITDTTPAKQGLFTPGTHIPIRGHEAWIDGRPDFGLLFAWNHEAEILAKEQAFRASGGKFIVYVPRVEVLA